MSYRLTFSLASLVFLIALGLVFVPTAVMAHDSATSAVDTIRPHSHPVNETIPADTGAGGTGLEVPPHNGHPKATLSLKAIDDKAKGNEVVIGAAPASQTDGVDANEFVLIIDYGQDVAGVATQRIVDRTASPIAIVGTDFTGLVRNAKGADIGTGVGALTIGDATAVDDSNSQFMVTVLVGDTAIPTGTKDDDLETVEVRLRLGAQNDVFSLATLPDAVITQVPGGENDVASDVYTLTLIKAFPGPPPDTTPPTVKVTAPDALTDGKLPFMMAFSKTIAGGPGLAAFTERDITIDGGSAMFDSTGVAKANTDFTVDGMVYTLKVTPTTPETSVTVTISGDVEDEGGRLLNAAGSTLSATYDKTSPTVMITAPDAPENGNLTFTFVFSESIDADSFTSSDIRGSGFTIVASAPMKTEKAAGDTTMTETWTAKVTPTSATTNVTVGIDAGAVTDIKMNPLASGVTATYMPAPPPAPATAPGKPTAVTAVADQAADTITISWTAPTNTGTVEGGDAATITGYTVTKHYTDADGDAATKDFPATASPLMIPPAGSDDMLAEGVAFTFTVKATNSAGLMSAASDASNSVTIAPTNTAPTFADTAKDAYTYTVGTEVRSILPAAMDAEDAAADITYSIDDDTGLPEGLEFDEDSRVVSGTPTAAGTTDVRYIATDSGDMTAELLITFTVNAAGGPGTATNTPPTFATTATKAYTFTQGVAGSFILDAAADEGNLTYSISSATPLPAGLSFTASTRVVHGTPTAAGTTQVRYIATDSGGLTAELLITFTVNAVSSGRPVTGTAGELTGLSVPAESYVILVHNGYQGLPAHLTADQKQVWPGMPNLEKLLFSGGSITLTRAATPQLDPDGAGSAAARNAGARDLIITEVMWARNTARVGQVSETGHQWIEIYNPLKVAVGGVTVTTKAGRPPLTADAGEVLLDRLSNVVGGGWQLTGLGQDGYDDGNPDTSSSEFISMYRKERGKDGHTKGHWAQSTEVYLANHRGTPGAKERATGAVLTPTNANRGPVIFNEISNHDNPAYEWIELRNVSGGEQNLKNWEITILTSKGNNQSGHHAAELVQFPNADRKVPAGGILLVVATNPLNNDNHPLQTGWDITKGADDQRNGVNADSPRYIVLPFKTAGGESESGMPDDGEFVLVLRNRGDRTSSNGDNNTRDVAGYVPGAALKVDTGGLYTGLWPLVNFPQPNWDKNQLKAGEVHRRQFADIDGTKSKDKNQDDKTAFRNVGWTGIGYKRNAEAGPQNGGTPGYPNNALKSYETVATSMDFTTPVVISEVMFGTGRRVNMPQWIELYNTSKTEGISLDGWRLRILNHDQEVDGKRFDGDLSKDHNLSGRIPPGQTFLITAYLSRNDTRLPDERIHALNSKRGGLILSQYGFEITLESKAKDNKDANRKVADRVGNLADAPTDARVRRNAQSYEDPAWMLPMGTNEDGNRVSIVRTPRRDGTFVDGQIQAGWTRFDLSNQYVTTLEETSYGHDSDLASPGYTVGGVLPVSLSKFRPERLATGEVVVRWVTESELDNAGFNILRSETKDGEFTKLNTKLIAGKGTTSEKTSYEFVDTSAKPNVVYYYQIQDVSLDGDVATLKTTHLRGNVSAAGKLTTTWGELKALQ